MFFLVMRGLNLMRALIQNREKIIVDNNFKAGFMAG